ncbi:MAG: hypothetical protein HQM10_00210 [Candidatus Riflebacteria bacterium]|nr:hypothetical protein [Candidatus Riflebacteria bacterium]
MNIKEFDWLESHKACKSPYGLNRMEHLMEKLEMPNLDSACVLIGGTNGKGSVTSILESISISGTKNETLFEDISNYSVASTISPHLLHFTERIRLQGKKMSDKMWIEGINSIKKIVKDMKQDPNIGEPSFFELVTSIFFWSLRESLTDLAFVEVGLGGKLDATNVCQPEISVITNIGTDHKEYLGPDKPSIAREKLGILRKRGTLITSEKDPEILKIFENECVEKKADLILSDQKSAFTLLESTSKHHKIFLPGSEEPVIFPLPGRHQLDNLALSLAVIEKLRKNDFQFSEDSIREGIRNVRWPGRLQWVEDRTGYPPILLDGAHNREGLASLKNYLNDFPLPKPLHLILGVLSNKPAIEMAHDLAPYADTLIFVPPKANHATEESEFNELIKPLDKRWQWCNSLSDALEQGKNSGSILVSGSLYLISDFFALHKF